MSSSLVGLKSLLSHSTAFPFRAKNRSCCSLCCSLQNMLGPHFEVTQVWVIVQMDPDVPEPDLALPGSTGVDHVVEEPAELINEPLPHRGDVSDLDTARLPRPNGTRHSRQRSQLPASSSLYPPMRVGTACPSIEAAKLRNPGGSLPFPDALELPLSGKPISTRVARTGVPEHELAVHLCPFGVDV